MDQQHRQVGIGGKPGLHDTTGDDLRMIEHRRHGLIRLITRLLLTLALSGITAFMLTGCAGGDTEGAPTTTQASPASLGEIKALVRTRASKSLPVQSVICSAMSEDLFFCAVTYTGPSCELWDVDGGKTIALPAIDGASGSRTAKGGVRCGQSP